MSFLLLSKILAVVLRFVSPNPLLQVFGSEVSRSMSLVEILIMRGRLCFSGLILIVLLSVSMSVHSVCQASPHLAPVSFSSCRKVPVSCPHPAMSWSSSVSVGMNGNVSTRLYLGGFLVPPACKR